MDALNSLLVFSLLPQLVVPEFPTVTSYRAIVQIVSGSSRIFKGESLQLRCSIPDVYKASWNYVWFKGSVQLPESGEVFHLWKANVKQSGKYSCLGKKETQVGSIRTQRSLPTEIHVDGGFAILQTPQHPILVGDTLDLRCRLRGRAPVHQTILYRDGIEVVVLSGSSLSFLLPNVTLEDMGMYTCRVSWDLSRRTHSVMSVPTPVDILEVVTEPLLEIDEVYSHLEPNKIKLICHLQYNARAPAPPITYYFYKNNNLVGPGISLNYLHVRRTPGWYSCRAKVPKLGITRWSDPRSFGEVTELPSMPKHPHRNQMIFSPSKHLPHNFVTPASQSAATKHFTTKPYFNQHTEHSDEESLTHSEPPLSPVLTSPNQFPGQTQNPAA